MKLHAFAVFGILLTTRSALAEVRDVCLDGNGETVNLPLVPMPRQVVLAESVYVTATNVTSVAAACRSLTDAALPVEGYEIAIRAETGPVVRAADAAGRFYALKTLEQLAEPMSKGGYSFRCLDISDAPAYAWRGVMLDEGRYFFGVNAVKDVLDEMARFKMNVFHWHLTEDQGWRLDVVGLHSEC